MNKVKRPSKINKNIKDNIIVYVSSRNNYDMVEGAVLKNIQLDGYEFINVDDCSCDAEIAKGREQSKRIGFTFLQNKKRGVQYATQTVIDWVNKNRPNCKYIVCFQHDNYPISDNFFDSMNEQVKSLENKKVGIIGFNHLDNGSYTGDALKRYQNSESNVKGMIGMCHLTVMDNRKRWLCPTRQPDLIKHKGFDVPFSMEFPMWAGIGINVKAWNDIIKPTEDYHFHLWVPDIAFQFNFKNYMSVILPNLYCMNDQKLKSKFGIHENSAHSAKDGNKYHFGEYGPHLSNFKKRWGWDYENVEKTFPKVKDKYVGTLIEKYYMHDINKGPLWKL